MRWQRNAHRGSRPVSDPILLPNGTVIPGDVLGHPNPTRHTAESYRSMCRHQRLGYLTRLRRLERREAGAPDRDKNTTAPLIEAAA